MKKNSEQIKCLQSPFRAQYCVPVFSTETKIKLRILFWIDVELSLASGEDKMLKYLFEFVKSMAMRSISFLVVIPCNVVEICLSFRGTAWLNLQI
jgi:hypothetical protein